MKDSFNIKEIISVIFDGKDELIYSKSNAILRGTEARCEDIKKKLFQMSMENKFALENKNIKSLIKTLKLIYDNIVYFPK